MCVALGGLASGRTKESVEWVQGGHQSQVPVSARWGRVQGSPGLLRGPHGSSSPGMIMGDRGGSGARPVSPSPGSVGGGLASPPRKGCGCRACGWAPGLGAGGQLQVQARPAMVQDCVLYAPGLGPRGPCFLSALGVTIPGWVGGAEAKARVVRRPSLLPARSEQRELCPRCGSLSL